MKTLKQQTKRAALFCLIVGAACVIASQLSGCGSGPQGAQGPAGQGYQAPTESSTQQQINAIIANENAWRETQGQTFLTSGLSCTVQAVSSGGFLSTASPNYVAANCTAASLSAACALVTTGTSYPYLLTVGFNQANSGPGPNSVIDPGLQLLDRATRALRLVNPKMVVRYGAPQDDADFFNKTYEATIAQGGLKPHRYFCLPSR